MKTKNWGAEECRAPKLADGDTLLFSECGRILNDIDYRAHYFRLVRGESGYISLLVEHGGGSERITEFCFRKILSGLELLDSDNRYLMIHGIYQAYSEGTRKAQKATADIYRAAFIQGRLKKRKVKEGIKVWIEPDNRASVEIEGAK